MFYHLGKNTTMLWKIYITLGKLKQSFPWVLRKLLWAQFMLETTWGFLLLFFCEWYLKLLKNIRQHVVFKHRNKAIISVKEFLGFTLKEMNTILNIPQ